MAKMNTIWIILSLAAHFGWEMHQFDVKNAFLNGSLEEEVYMEIFHLVMVPLIKGIIRCADLRRSCMILNNHLMLGLEGLLKVMVSLGYRQSKGDHNHTLFIKYS